MLTTLAGLSAIFALVFQLGIAWDIIRSVFAKLLKKEYSWRSPHYFNGDSSWDISLIFAVAYFVGMYVLYSELLRLHP